jgi:hypothetical protein
MTGLATSATTALFEVAERERAAAVDVFAATAAADGVIPATAATTGAGEVLEEALTAAAALGIAVHRFPPIDVIEAPAGRDMLKESRTSAQEKRSRIERVEEKLRAPRPSDCYHKHLLQCNQEQKSGEREEVGILERQALMSTVHMQEFTG